MVLNAPAGAPSPFAIVDVFETEKYYTNTLFYTFNCLLSNVAVVKPASHYKVF